MMEKYRVSLSEEERLELQTLVSSGKSAARKIAHANVLLLADDSQGKPRQDEDIATTLSLSLRTVSRIRKRFVTEGFDAALDHRPQPPRPDKIKIKGNVEQELVRIACCDPPDGRAHWTLQLLADELLALGHPKVSTETVRQALKKMTSTPGSSEPGAFHLQVMGSSSGEWKT